MTPPSGAGIEFFRWFKQTSEAMWAERATRRFPQHTKWRPGLNAAHIDAAEAALGYRFPRVLRTMLEVMNGTFSPPGADIERVPGWIQAEWHFYGCENLDEVRQVIARACEGYDVEPSELTIRGIPHIHPIIGHRFLLVEDGDPRVLSIVGRDTIVYSVALRTFLLGEIGHEDPEVPALSDAVDQCAFWLDEAVYPPPLPDDMRDDVQAMIDKLPRS